MGEFFGETEQPVDPGARELMTDFQDLSEEARREVRDFARFKRLQELEQQPATQDGLPELPGPEQKP